MVQEEVIQMMVPVCSVQWPKQSIKNATETVNTNGTVNIADGQYTGSNNTGITH